MVSDYCRSIPGYERLEHEPAFDLSLYYHERDRHALYARAGVVFRMTARIDADAARVGFEGLRRLLSTRPGHPNPVLDYYQRVVPVESEARRLAIQKHATALYEALQGIHSASHDQYGTMVPVRPVRVSKAIDAAWDALVEASEDAREAGRAVRAMMPPAQTREAS